MFSPRGQHNTWNFRDQPPEFWDQFSTEFAPGTHVRVHPLLHWTELDIWRYTKREHIPCSFRSTSRRTENVIDRSAIRTSPSRSTPKHDIDAIIDELMHTKIAERAGRAMDHEAEDSFERLRAEGYMWRPERSIWISQAPGKIVEPGIQTTLPLKIVIVGHVDHGKSTLVGRLFHDTGTLRKVGSRRSGPMCEKRGMPFEWAFLLDALQAERDQGITIDISQIFFRTAMRNYVLIDAPGHREFVKNMITGARRRKRPCWSSTPAGRRAGADAPARLPAAPPRHPSDRRRDQQDGPGRILGIALSGADHRSASTSPTSGSTCNTAL